MSLSPVQPPKAQRAFAHISLTVRSLPLSSSFYSAVLAALGWQRLFYHADTGVMGFGCEGEEVLTVYEAKGRVGEGEVGGWAYGTHLAFHAETQDQVLQFHTAALQHGGTSDGAPGVRDYYGPGYYGAFVRDADGHRLEAVAHLPVDEVGRVDFGRMG
ncbi:hypothetical protein CALCODRAFT_340385 [Calocera cornea HHB12733]|uniref:VOC domain-containing protein n=1 Tax=Calocera cornea HHB12733 TaxID=1353952 RepID=A0A165EZ30_9BASI|nr:hypothetical protein CALCODRAFT_340385 [Calocera cornea HHB12733]